MKQSPGGYRASGEADRYLGSRVPGRDQLFVPHLLWGGAVAVGRVTVSSHDTLHFL